MGVARLILLFCTLTVCTPRLTQAEEIAADTGRLELASANKALNITETRLRDSQLEQPFKGWGYLVYKLKLRGVAEQDLEKVYNDPRMPPFSFVPFRLKPRETVGMYKGFATRSQFILGAEFASRHKREFDRIEKTLHVPREVVTAIILVESHLGKNTGSALIIERLSRVASAGEPKNISQNLEALQSESPHVERSHLEERARYLEATFLPEIPALLEICKRNKLDVLEIRGSSAGAFGMPQFLPSAFLRFGVDGDRDGTISLFNEVDALWSTAKFLSAFGYRHDLLLKEKRAVLWRYNKSDPYIDTVLAVSSGIRAVLKAK